MKRTDFIASVAAVSALPLIPKIAKAETRDVSLKRHLPANAVVKFERFREWTDEMTREPQAIYKIRYTVVPDVFTPCEFDKRPFVTKWETETLPDGSARELEAWTFVFVSYGVHASGRDEIRSMRREISSGLLSPSLCLEGGVPAPYVPNCDPSRSFPAMVKWQTKYQNRAYALWKETGVHPDFNAVLRDVRGMTA